MSAPEPARSAGWAAPTLAAIDEAELPYVCESLRRLGASIAGHSTVWGFGPDTVVRIHR